MANFNLAAHIENDEWSPWGNMQVTYIPLSKLIANERNFFVVEDVQELADNIKLHGLDNPLTVREIGDGTYRIVAGHRRRKALELLGCKTAPCIIKNYDGEDSELVALIQSNLTSRELTYYEKMEAVIRLEKALRSMKERGVELPGRLRDHLAEQAGESTSAVHRMTYIHKKLSPALLDALRREQIGESVADELAHSPKAVQKEFEKRLERGETIRAQDVKATRDKPTPEEQALRQLDAQMRQAVQEIAPPTEATAPQPAEAQVWHPYPAERPAEGQLVLTQSYNRYTRTNYAAYVYRAEGWYLPELPDDGLMTVDVRWWTAELPPEGGNST